MEHPKAIGLHGTAIHMRLGLSMEKSLWVLLYYRKLLKTQGKQMGYMGTIRDRLEQIHDMLPLTERELTFAIWAVEGNGEMELADDIAKQPKWWGEKAAKAYKVLQDEDFVESPLKPPPLTDATSELIALVELLPEAQDPSTDLWAAVFIARESLRAATLSENKGDE